MRQEAGRLRKGQRGQEHKKQRRRALEPNEPLLLWDVRPAAMETHGVPLHMFARAPHRKYSAGSFPMFGSPRRGAGSNWTKAYPSFSLISMMAA